MKGAVADCEDFDMMVLDCFFDGQPQTVDRVASWITENFGPVTHEDVVGSFVRLTTAELIRHWNGGEVKGKWLDAGIVLTVPGQDALILRAFFPKAEPKALAELRAA